MITVNHIAVFVEDLDRSRAFYETYFGGIAGERYANPRTGLQTYFLSFDGFVRLEIMVRPDVEADRSEVTRAWNHVAFSVGSMEAVVDLTEKLRAGGYRIAGEPRTTGDGYFESVIVDPDGNLVEVTV